MLCRIFWDSNKIVKTEIDKSSMSLKEIIREKALELGFKDAGFTGVEPLDPYIKEIESRPT